MLSKDSMIKEWMVRIMKNLTLKKMHTLLLPRPSYLFEFQKGRKNKSEYLSALTSLYTH